MTLLERFSKPAGQYGIYWLQRQEVEELCSALAIAQAVEEACKFRDMKAAVAHNFKARADELLRGEK